jgi:hypothetical protein
LLKAKPPRWTRTPASMAGQVNQRAAPRYHQSPDPLAPVGAEVVHDDDLAWPQGWREYPLEVGLEGHLGRRTHHRHAYKGPHQDLVAAYAQLQRYREDLENPPLSVYVYCIPKPKKCSSGAEAQIR